MNTIDAQNQQEMLKRLARVEGQLRGVQNLIRNGSECEIVAQQLSAARKALDKAFHEMMACMIEHDVLHCADKADARIQMDQIRKLLTKYS